MMHPYKWTKRACYTAYFTMSTIFSLPPVLFMTFRELYGISYTLLGTLVLTNFCTQLAIDLIFTLFAKHFNVKKVVRVMPLITTLGLSVYAIVPMLSPQNAYVGLFTGTVLFSVSAGLSEVLLSPIIAAIPSDTPGRDMSLLHSLYAFGVFTVVVVSTAFLRLFGQEYWMYLTLFLAVWPILASVMFFCSPMPDMATDHAPQQAKTRTGKRALGLALCVGCIFFGSCAENAMSNWISGYVEKVLNIDKSWSDLLGMAMFAILLGLVRITYAKYGKKIIPILLIGMIGASVCYLTVAFTNNTVVAITACVLTGLFTSMLWPGTLIMMEENIPGAGVTAFALMAAGGDLGASVAPQLLGAVTDWVSAGPAADRMGQILSVSAQQAGLKTGMLVCSVFPILGTIVVLCLIAYFKKQKKGTVAH